MNDASIHPPDAYVASSDVVEATIPLPMTPDTNYGGGAEYGPVNPTIVKLGGIATEALMRTPTETALAPPADSALLADQARQAIHAIHDATA